MEKMIIAGYNDKPLIKGEMTHERILGLFEALCDATDNHPMTVIFTAYDRKEGGTETDEDVPHFLTRIAQDLFDLDDSDIIAALAARFDSEGGE